MLGLGLLKQALVAAGYPAEDLAGYVTGDALPINWWLLLTGATFNLREYQHQAALINRSRTRRKWSDRVSCCGR